MLKTPWWLLQPGSRGYSRGGVLDKTRYATVEVELDWIKRIHVTPIGAKPNASSGLFLSH